MSWVLPGRTTIGGSAHSPRARPRHPTGSRGRIVGLYTNMRLAVILIGRPPFPPQRERDWSW